MPTELLIVTPFKKALSSLKKALATPKNEISRDASIQRFEYTFELAWKTLKRHLTNEAGLKEYNIKNIFREAARAGLITNIDEWFAYLEARNLTSHTYNEDVAEETYKAAKQFATAAEDLLKKLEKHYAHTTHK